MLTHRRGRLAPTYAWLTLLWVGCGDDATSPPGISTGTGPGAGRDAGSDASTAPPSPRPDGGPVLPAAEDEVVLALGGDAIRYPIEIEADPGVLDVHLSIDTSGSIAAEIDALQRDLGSIAGHLRERVPSVSFGVSRFEDFPEPPFGHGPRAGERLMPGDTPFRLLAPVTSDEARVESAVASLDQPLGNGGDIPESGAEALWQIATGEGYSTRGIRFVDPYERRAAPGGGTAGGVGFREGALRVLLHVTDAPSHDRADYADRFPDTHDMQDAAQALADIGVRLIAIVSGACHDDEASSACDGGPHAEARFELEQVALATGSLGEPDRDGTCPFGLDGAAVASIGGRCPLVFDVSGSGQGLAGTVTDAIVQLVDGVRFGQVTGEASDDPLGFVQRVVPVSARTDGASAEPAAQIADLLPDGAPDGEPDGFVQVRAKARLRFEVELRNTRIAPLDVDQRFRLVVRISGDGLTLEEHTLRVRVPAGDRIAPALPDAGRADASAPTDDDAGT